MTAVLSLALLGLCVFMLIAHFGEIKNSHRNGS